MFSARSDSLGMPGAVVEDQPDLQPMKITVERAELVKALAHVHRVVERRNTIPILANVLVRAGKNGLELKATDLDLEIVETVPAEVKQASATTVPAHMLYDIVRKLPEGAQVELQAGGDRASLAVEVWKSSQLWTRSGPPFARSHG